MTTIASGAASSSPHSTAGRVPPPESASIRLPFHADAGPLQPRRVDVTDPTPLPTGEREVPGARTRGGSDRQAVCLPDGGDDSGHRLGEAEVLRREHPG